jgi:hypothetical protein
VETAFQNHVVLGDGFPWIAIEEAALFAAAALWACSKGSERIAQSDLISSPALLFCFENNEYSRGTILTIFSNLWLYGKVPETTGLDLISSLSQSQYDKYLEEMNENLLDDAGLVEEGCMALATLLALAS